jgi:hypothetical protein
MANELRTYGDLKKAIQLITLKQKVKNIAGGAGDVAIEAAIDAAKTFIPGIGTAKTTFDFIKAAISKPDAKKTKTWLDKLDIDDDMSKIIDNTVENGFMQMISKTIEDESDSKPLEQDFNMNQKLVDYLKQNYSGRTISGITENKIIQMKKSDLIKMIKEEIKSSDIKSLVKLVDNNTTLKTKLQTVNNAQELQEFLEYILNSINPKITGVDKSKLKSIIDNRF